MESKDKQTKRRGKVTYLGWRERESGRKRRDKERGTKRERYHGKKELGGREDKERGGVQ